MKKKNDDFEFIKNKFDVDGIEAPQTLSESEIRRKIETGTEHKTIKLKKRTPVKAIASCAACFVLVFAVVAAGIFPKIKTSTQTEKAPSQGVSTFESYDEIREYVKEIKKEQKARIAYEFSVDKSDAAETIIGSSDTGSSYAETYKQVEAVDEADYIKTDGEYIYYSDQYKIYIYKTNSGEPYQAAVIDYFESSSSYVQEMFLHDNLLIVNLVGYGNYSDDDYITTVTSTEIYDVSNPEAPELVNKLSQSGYYSSSRMLGDMLYIVSQEYLDETSIIPYTEQNGSKEALSCSDICYTGEPSDASYVIISAINTQNGGKYSDTAAVFGGSSNIYCNEKNMYITSFERDASYDSLFGRGGAESIGMASTGTTHIIKLSLNGSEIRVTASGSVDGYTNNQFSMDEYEGNLRIAVTSSDITNSETDNSLYVLDENLNEIGKITDLAKGESIKAVRFSENIAYVITYEQTDPLFVIDLSDPASPTLLGSVEITGFSSMLIPLENGRILGVGYATSQSETGEALNGIKLVLFDVSDPTAPSVLSTKVFEDADSDAQYTHKALVVNNEKGYYAIPFNRYNESLLQNDSGAMTFTVENDEIVVTNIFINPVDTDDYSYTARCTFAGDYVYSLTNSPEIFAHEYK